MRRFLVLGLLVAGFGLGSGIANAAGKDGQRGQGVQVVADEAHQRVDIPHHAGMWFNYGNVNGFDFWNNSDAIKPEGRSRMGTIYQKKIVSTKSGVNQGELVVESLWVNGEGKDILKDTTRYVFSKR